MEGEMMNVLQKWTEGEINNFIKVWISVYISLSYCYFIGKIVPKGKLRLLTLLPVISVFLALPLTLHTMHLGGMTAFFIAWLSNFKLLMFAFGIGPLSHPSLSLLHFLAIGSLPIKIQHNPSPNTHFKENPSPNTYFQENPSSNGPFQENPSSNGHFQENPSSNGDLTETLSPKNSKQGLKSPLNYATKALLVALFVRVYDYSEYIHPSHLFPLSHSIYTKYIVIIQQFYSMIELLAKLILMEAVLLIALSFKTFLRKPATKAIDFVVVKQGQAPIIVLTIGLTFIALLIFTLYIILQIHHRSIRTGSINSADQLLLPHKLLQASLTGFLLFLSIIIYKFHHLMGERGSLKKIIEAEEKQLEVRKHFITVQVHELENEVARLRARIKKLESECQRKTYEANAKEATVLALKQQSEDFNLEYDRLLEYNQILQNQLQSIDQILLKDEQETVWSGFKASIMRDGLNLIPWDIQEPKKSRAEVCSDNEVVKPYRYHKLLLTDSHAPSSPRHRRPIYQH